MTTPATLPPPATTAAGPDLPFRAVEQEDTPTVGALDSGASVVDAKRLESQQALAAAQARVSRQVRELAQAERQQRDQQRRDSVAALLALADRARADALALACGPLAAKGDLVGAVTACHQAGAKATCLRWSNLDPTCPRRRERERVQARIARLVDSRVPGADTLAAALASGQVLNHTAAPAWLLLAAEGGWRLPGGALVPPRPLAATDPLRCVQAWLERSGEPIRLAGGGAVRFGAGDWCLVLGGDVGTGKTVAACWAALVRPALFAAAPELVQHDAPVSVRQAAEAPLLILDDLGTERNAASDYAVDTLSDLLITRHRHRRPTVITTNLRSRRRKPTDPEGLLERYGERLFDPSRGRVLEGMTLVGFTGASLRGAK